MAYANRERGWVECAGDKACTEHIVLVEMRSTSVLQCDRNDTRIKKSSRSKKVKTRDVNIFLLVKVPMEMIRAPLQCCCSRNYVIASFYCQRIYHSTTALMAQIYLYGDSLGYFLLYRGLAFVLGRRKSCRNFSKCCIFSAETAVITTLPMSYNVHENKETYTNLDAVFSSVECALPVQSVTRSETGSLSR